MKTLVSAVLLVAAALVAGRRASMRSTRGVAKVRAVKAAHRRVPADRGRT